jgi:RNA polymerase sigma-70 factor, ECF subfamily
MSSERVRHEEALRGAVLAGEQAAWRALYDGAYQALWAYIVWRCGGLRDIAEEITQETWLVAVRRIADFEPKRGSFQAWLRGIAGHCLRNHFRARRRRPEQTLRGDLPENVADGRAEEAELIAQALAELSEHYEAVLRAKYLDLGSVAQIAEEWAETPKAIESLLTRARQAFRTAYEKLTEPDVAFKEPKP